MRGMAHAGFCPPPRSLSNQRASWIAPRARTHAHTYTQAPCVDNAREFRHSVPASPTIRMLVCMPCGGNNSGWRVRATGQWPGLVRLPRGGVGRGPGRATPHHNSKTNVSTGTMGVQGPPGYPGGGFCALELVGKTVQTTPDIWVFG